jgi:hypothetical protein
MCFLMQGDSPVSRQPVVPLAAALTAKGRGGGWNGCRDPVRIPLFKIASFIHPRRRAIPCLPGKLPFAGRRQNTKFPESVKYVK